MKRTLLILLPLMVSWQAARAEDWTKRWTLGPEPTVRVDTNDAAVEVEAVEGDSADAHVSTRGWTIGPSGVQVIEHQTGNRLDLDVRIPHSPWSLLHGGEHSVHVLLHVPRQSTAEIRTSDGSIRVNGVHGSLRLNTGDGSIEADNLDGSVEARSGDGHMRINGRFDAVNLHTQDGSVELSAQAGSKMNGDWRLQTGDGHVTLRLPGNFAANLDAHTGDGQIHSDLPLAVQGASHEHEVQGKLNGGGMNLIIRTGDGSVRIEKI